MGRELVQLTIKFERAKVKIPDMLQDSFNIRGCAGALPRERSPVRRAYSTAGHHDSPVRRFRSRTSNSSRRSFSSVDSDRPPPDGFRFPDAHSRPPFRRLSASAGRFRPSGCSRTPSPAGRR